MNMIINFFFIYKFDCGISGSKYKAVRNISSNMNNSFFLLIKYCFEVDSKAYLMIFLKLGKFALIFQSLSNMNKTEYHIFSPTLNGTLIQQQ